MRWIFAQRLAGRSVAGIARDLNDRGIACPSAVEPIRNPYRTGAAWTLRTVAPILNNPRYTGRQAWNRQRTDYAQLSCADDVLGRSEARRWNDIQQWVISKATAHPALAARKISSQPRRSTRSRRESINQPAPRNIYVNERDAVTAIAALLGLPADPPTVASHVRKHQIVIVCGPGGTHHGPRSATGRRPDHSERRPAPAPSSRNPQRTALA